MTEVQEFAQLRYRPGVLPPKYQRLIAFVAAVLRDCRPEMRQHLTGARECGATDDEILQALYWAMRASANHPKHEAVAAMQDALGELITLEGPSGY